MLLTLLLGQAYIVRSNESTKNINKNVKTRSCIDINGFFWSLPVQRLCKLVKKHKLARTNIPQHNMAKSKLYTLSIAIWQQTLYVIISLYVDSKDNFW